MQFKVEITPIALLNISDDYTRQRINGKVQVTRTIGGLMGILDGGKIKCLQTIQFRYVLNPQTQEIESIDTNYIKERIELFKVDLEGNLFKDYEFLGWYSAGNGCNIMQNDIKIQRALMSEINENCIYLKIDTVHELKNRIDLPIKVYELKTEQKKDEFSEIIHDILTTKEDHIGIESASKTYSASSTKSQFAENLNTSLNAVKRFSEKIEKIIQFLDSQQVQQNPSLLLELNQLLVSFPQQFNNSYDLKIIEEFSESNIISFLSAISACNRVISNVTDYRQGFRNTKVNYY